MKTLVFESIEFTSLRDVKPFKCYWLDDKAKLKQFIDAISQMVDVAYASKGGYVGDSSSKSLLKNTDRAKLVFGNDRKLLAIALYRTDLGGYKRFCSAGIPHDNQSLDAVKTIVKDDIKPYSNWYWVEASDFIETLFKQFGGNPIPNYLAYEFLRLPELKLSLDADGVHYTRTVGTAKRKMKKMIFGFKDKATAEKACLSVANYEDFKLNTNKLLENDTSLDVACQVIRQVFELHDEMKCNEMLPSWHKAIVNAIDDVKHSLVKKNLPKSKQTMLKGVLARAQTCLSEMPKLVVKQFHVV